MVKLWCAVVDLPTLAVDAIVVGANTGLKIGSGNSAKGLRYGGARIEQELRRVGRLAHGEVAVTTGVDLPARHVFHAVTIAYEHDDQSGLLTRATAECLRRAEALGLRSLAFPAFSGGRMKVPPEASAAAMVRAIEEYDFSRGHLESVGFALATAEAATAFRIELQSAVSRREGLEYSEDAPPTVPLRQRPLNERLAGPTGRLP
jgi:O-acetyl-ADP-ribose deacetylase